MRALLTCDALPLWCSYNFVGSEAQPFSGAPVALNLTFIDTKGAVGQGDRGFDRKGQQPCSSSNYFSMTGLKLLEHPAVENYVVIGGERTDMAAGHAWYDVASMLNDET